MINYYLLTKPGIILGNLITFGAGFLLASKGDINLMLFIASLLGLAFIIASACVFNNYIDSPIDQKMDRTKKRPLAAGLVRGRSALLFAATLAILGSAILLAFTNVLTFALASAGFLIYVCVYSFWKSKTTYATAIGSIAGAIPPVVGYCAVTDRFDIGALILFSMMVLWQMPHFFAIAILHLEDYSKANLPLLPIIKGIARTKIHMILYIIAFILSAASLYFWNYTGDLYLKVAVVLGTAWLLLGFQGLISKDDKQWSRQMFRWSLVLITILSLTIPFDLKP